MKTDLKKEIKEEDERRALLNQPVKEIRKITKNNSLNFTAIFGQNSRGKNSPNTQEVTNLGGEKYNSYCDFNFKCSFKIKISKICLHWKSMGY